MKRILEKKGFICDMDGVIYHGNEILEGVREFVNWMIEHDKKFVLSDDEISVLKAKALPYLTERTEYFAKIMGVEPTGIKITSAEERFGSCSGKNSICYSWRLMLYPPEAVDYVVVHELAHIKHHNHSKDFYKFIEQFIPDYKERMKL